MATKTEHLAPLLEVLTNLPPGAKLELTKLPTGEFAVSDTDAPKTSKAEMLDRPEYRRLRGHGITISEAAEKYGVPRKIIEHWVYRSNYVHFVDEVSYPKQVDEAEVALCVSIYKKRQADGTPRNLPFFDEGGFLVGERKHEDLAKKRRLAREIEKSR